MSREVSDESFGYDVETDTGRPGGGLTGVFVEGTGQSVYVQVTGRRLVGISGTDVDGTPLPKSRQTTMLRDAASLAAPEVAGVLLAATKASKKHPLKRS